ncbi:tyrosine-protein phosphatase [Blastococcus sp. TML/M2B]|uniref:tyrosine-protein phosphatase n=1 Tax=unclassified Blastococcus TaxID=2619396 RepID=UPI00190CB8B2|nr:MULTISPECIES: tyrosine-protein phosphatase [unclassified Blastococcus]MBN1091724.1 tyrosine-protein phosphatase [Blastococcus sp. TML/M2B]MBN1094715.1 tyrosine-protein phosphatase [Blastococcus sp. TML/C7B]
MDARPARSRGVLRGFANSADLGGLPAPRGSEVPTGRVIRANTPARLSEEDLAAAHAVRFAVVLDLRSSEELVACPHPLANSPAYRWLPLIDPAAEAGEDFSRYRTLGEIYSSSLQRNAAHIAAIFGAVASAPPGPVLISCRAGRDRTGMIAALLLDLAGVDRQAIAADHALPPAGTCGTNAADPASGDDILEMLDHVSAAYGSTAQYLRWLGLDGGTVDSLSRRLAA